MKIIGYIFIVRRLGKQSNPILSRSDSISNLEINLKIHGPCGLNAHAGADLQAFLTFCFKPNLLSEFMAITVTLEEGKDILREIHEPVCGNHAASRTLVGKAYRSGFFWPTAVSDA